MSPIRNLDITLHMTDAALRQDLRHKHDPARSFLFRFWSCLETGGVKYSKERYEARDPPHPGENIGPIWRTRISENFQISSTKHGIFLKSLLLSLTLTL